MLYAHALFSLFFIHSLGVLTLWIFISRFVAIYYCSDIFEEDHRHLEEPEFSLTRSFLGILCIFFIPSLSWFYALDLCLFHFLFDYHHVRMFICDIAVILIYYSNYIACSGYFRLSVYAWVFFLAYIRRRFSSRLRFHIFWEAGRDRHDNYSHSYHSLEGHLQGLGLTSGQHSSTDYSSIGEYSTSSAEYQGFGYYHHGADIAQQADIAQHPPPYYSDVESSSQSSQPTGSYTQAYYYPYENYTPGFYTYRVDCDNDEFVLHRNSTWK